LGSITAPPAQWQALIHYYDGNPFILKIVAGVIQQFMQGNLTRYLETVEKGEFALADLTDLLKGHLERLSPREQEILEWLAIADHPLTLEELQAHLVSHQAQGQVINILESLQRRSLLHQDHQTFTISSVLKQHIRQASALTKVQ
jgi:predicted ATPase